MQILLPYLGLVVSHAVDLHVFIVGIHRRGTHLKPQQIKADLLENPFPSCSERTVRYTAQSKRRTSKTSVNSATATIKHSVTHRTDEGAGAVVVEGDLKAAVTERAAARRVHHQLLVLQLLQADRAALPRVARFRRAVAYNRYA